MTIPDSDAFNWIIGPVTRAISYVAEEAKVAGTLHRSLIVLEGNEIFLQVARERLAAAGAHDAVRGIDKLIAEAPMLSKWAAELKADDFAVVNSHSLVGMWGAVEVAIEDTIVLVLSKDAAALGTVASAGVKTSAFEPPPLSEDNARRLYGRMEKQLREGLKVGEFYAKLLGLFGIKVSCSKHVLSKLEEVNSVRNCLLHRGGIIDERAAQSSGNLRPLLGKRISITTGRYMEYYAAAGDFIQEMLKGVIASSYIKTKPQEPHNPVGQADV